MSRKPAGTRSKVRAAGSARPRGITIHVPPPRKAQGGPGRRFPPGNPWRYVKGQSGNPAGERPLLGANYRKLLALIVPDDPLKRTYGELVAETVADLALAGHLGAAVELRTASEGTRTVLSFEEELEARIAKDVREGTVKVSDITHDLPRDMAERILRLAGMEWPNESEAPHGDEA
jgi:hypothetical protein